MNIGPILICTTEMGVILVEIKYLISDFLSRIQLFLDGDSQMNYMHSFSSSGCKTERSKLTLVSSLKFDEPQYSPWTYKNSHYLFG